MNDGFFDNLRDEFWLRLWFRFCDNLGFRCGLWKNFVNRLWSNFYRFFTGLGDWFCNSILGSALS